jgi:beta-xylosidase
MPICFKIQAATGELECAHYPMYNANAFENGWAVALSTRSGPDYLNYPMGRETVLTPVVWEEAEFPVFTAVSGEMSGWQLPRVNLDVDGVG